MDICGETRSSQRDSRGRIIYTSSTDKSVPLLPLEKAFFVACDLVLPPEKAFLALSGALRQLSQGESGML